MCSQSRVRSINIHFIQQVVQEHQPHLHPSSLIMQFNIGLQVLFDFMPDDSLNCDSKRVDDYVWVIKLLLGGLYDMFDKKILIEKSLAIEFEDIIKNVTQSTTKRRGQ